MKLPAVVVGPIGALLLAGPAGGQAPVPSHATFSAGVERFTLSVVVRDRGGELVSGLTREDFEVLDRGVSRPVVEFRAEPAPVSAALLLDVSGSMAVSRNLSRARDAAIQLLGWLGAPGDELALFTFDTQLRSLDWFEPPSMARLETFFDDVRPFGTTSLRDAIASAAEQVSDHAAGRHRAVIVLTDGMDTSSRMTAAEVSALASAVHVPVYVVMTVSRLDRQAGWLGPGGGVRAASGELSNLTRWTGGTLLAASQPAQFNRAAREIVSELRQQYWLAVEPGTEPGWHPLEVRTRNRGLSVRARSGYVIEAGVADR